MTIDSIAVYGDPPGIDQVALPRTETPGPATLVVAEGAAATQAIAALPGPVAGLLLVAPQLDTTADLSAAKANGGRIEALLPAAQYLPLGPKLRDELRAGVSVVTGPMADAVKTALATGYAIAG